MTSSQRTALDHPCFLAGETINLRYGFTLPSPPRSIVLTVNAGYE